HCPWPCLSSTSTSQTAFRSPSCRFCSITRASSCGTPPSPNGLRGNRSRRLTFWTAALFRRFAFLCGHVTGVPETKKKRRKSAAVKKWHSPSKRSHSIQSEKEHKRDAMSDSGVFTIYTDGAARGNPGPAAYAYIIERPGADDIEFNQRLGDTTNNVA